MANFEIPTNPTYSEVMRKLESTDKATADLFNEMFQQMLNNFAAIVAGQTAVGDSAKLDGHDSEYFAKSTDLEDYFKKTGGIVENSNGQPVIINNTDTNGSYTGTLFRIAGINKMWIGSRNGVPTVSTDLDTWNALHHDGNSVKMAISETPLTEENSVRVW